MIIFFLAITTIIYTLLFWLHSNYLFFSNIFGESSFFITAGQQMAIAAIAALIALGPLRLSTYINQDKGRGFIAIGLTLIFTGRFALPLLMALGYRGSISVGHEIDALLGHIFGVIQSRYFFWCGLALVLGGFSVSFQREDASSQ